MRRLAALAVCLTVVSACGSGVTRLARERALREGIGMLGSGRVHCDRDTCTVIARSPLHSNYEGFLLAVPVVDTVISDPKLAGVRRITLTLNDDRSGQVFSLTCATADLAKPTTTASLHRRCHSIYL